MISAVNIPRVPNFVETEQVENAFNTTFGDKSVKTIDVLPKVDKNGVEYNMMFVHFNEENASKELLEYSERIVSGEELFIVYDNKGHYFKTRKLMVRPVQKRLFTQAELLELKKDKGDKKEDKKEDDKEDKKEDKEDDKEKGAEDKP